MALALALYLILAGCGDETGRVNNSGTPRYPPVPELHNTPPPPARVQEVPGVEGLIGANADELARQFGRARLDVWEGDAHKLQFGATACVLDVYLYPLKPGLEPVATFVAARRGTDGRNVDRAACITLLRRR